MPALTNLLSFEHFFAQVSLHTLTCLVVEISIEVWLMIRNNYTSHCNATFQRGVSVCLVSGGFRQTFR